MMVMTEMLMILLRIFQLLNDVSPIVILLDTAISESHLLELQLLITFHIFIDCLVMGHLNDACHIKNQRHPAITHDGAAGYVLHLGGG